MYFLILECTTHSHLCDECVIDACTKCYLNRIPETREGEDKKQCICPPEF